MKRNQNNCPPPSYGAFDVTNFLREIDRILPTIKTAYHRAKVLETRRLLMAVTTSTPPEPGEVPTCPVGTIELLTSIIETLRCCGIAPPGWPQPPGPDAFIRSRKITIAGWHGTDGNGGQSL